MIARIRFKSLESGARIHCKIKIEMTVVYKLNLTNFISVLIAEESEPDDDEELINKVAFIEQDSFKHLSSSTNKTGRFELSRTTFRTIHVKFIASFCTYTKICCSIEVCINFVIFVKV